MGGSPPCPEGTDDLPAQTPSDDAHGQAPLEVVLVSLEHVSDQGFIPRSAQGLLQEPQRDAGRLGVAHADSPAARASSFGSSPCAMSRSVRVLR